MIGQVLNHRYEILDKAGEGGMATTYRGRDRVLGRVVAIKVMKPELAADAEFLARFRREARASAGVLHEHVAGVYDTGSDGAYHYIVMEYVEGESLKDRLRRQGPLPLEEALRIAVETSEALEAAHAVGVVHRDIKPHNILLGREGQVKVTDFGIARAMSSSSHTDTGRILGSVHYLSPEQARGDVVGPQGDIYSLGVTLFEMLVGKPPFDGGDRLAVLHKHIYDRPARATDLRPGLPKEVESVISLCLEKDLSRRFASARELRSYLLACPHQELAAWRRGWLRNTWTHRLLRTLADAAWWARQRAVWLGLAMLVIAAGIVSLTWWASVRGASSLVPVPEIVRMSALAARQRLEAAGLQYQQIGARGSEEIPAGAVLSQDPAPGLRVAPHTAVKVTLSRGPQQVAVPAVTEMSLEQAKRYLEDHGLVCGAVKEDYHDRIPAGYIAGTFPPANTRVAPGAKVDIVVSLGPRPPMPQPPPLPTPPGAQTGREETIIYSVPSDLPAGSEATVTIEASDENGRRVLYEGVHKPGEQVPPQKITVTTPTTVRILLNGEVRWERQYAP